MVLGRIMGLVFRASWGLLKGAAYLIFLPLIIIGALIGGLMRLALPVLLIAGLVYLLGGRGDERL